MKHLSIYALVAVLVAASSPSFSQTADKRLEDALAEIALLKRVVAEQDRRIADLEKSVRALQSSAVSPVPSPLPGRAGEEQSTVRQPSSIAWKNPSVWERVKDGMSQAQVVAILGQPTSVEDFGPYRTLFYRGEVPGSGYVSGNVKLTDDRVWQVNRPVF